MKEFKDKVIVVTGGARGIGKAIAVEGAKRGMNVVLNDIDPLVCETAKEIEAMGVKCVAQNADISIYENIEALLKLTLDTFGHVDILVNNAGCAVSGAIWKLPKRDIDWITELNFLSHLYGMKIFLPQMIAQGTPCEIVNVESTAGWYVDMVGAEAEVKILTKTPFMLLRLDIPVGGHDDVRGHFFGPVRANGIIFPFL